MYFLKQQQYSGTYVLLVSSILYSSLRNRQSYMYVGLYIHRECHPVIYICVSGICSMVYSSTIINAIELWVLPNSCLYIFPRVICLRATFHLFLLLPRRMSYNRPTTSERELNMKMFCSKMVARLQRPFLVGITEVGIGWDFLPIDVDIISYSNLSRG